MNRALANRFGFALLCGIAISATVCAKAQSNLVAHEIKAAAMPPLPPLKSPVDTFRELLAMSPMERQLELAKRPRVIRERLAVKVREYASMKPEERELRLQMTQVRWYFSSCLNVPAEQRGAYLAPLAGVDRTLVEGRLKQWDQLPVEERREILLYESTMEKFAGQNLEGAAATNKIVATVPVENRQAALQNLDEFLKLPVDQRLQICSSFQNFFELSETEKQKTLEALPAIQRQQTSDSIKSILQLSKEERGQYIEAVRKFSALNDKERSDFLRNAERWRQLSPIERQAWRTLINRLASQPPLPPDLITPPLPSQPPGPQNRPLITNGS